MPFASLRRKTVDATPSIHNDKKPASGSFRTRSATLPSLSPRKSLSALLDTARGRRPASPSQKNPPPGALDEDNYPEHEASNTDHDLQRCQASSPDKSRRFRRSPSPHPLKGSVSSRLSKINGTGLNRRGSESSMKGEPPSKNFFETLANAIRAPASMFYKENKQTLRADDTDLLTSKTASASEESEPLTEKSAPEDDTSLLKSVRFTPSDARIDPEARSSPINIPQPTPPLPQVEPATTPPLQCHKKLEDPVPTGRPPATHIMRSSEDFRKALAETKPFDILDNMNGPMQDPHSSDPSTPLSDSDSALEDPFDDAAQEVDPAGSRAMLKEYNDRFQSSKSRRAISSTDAVIDSDFVYNNGTVQESGSFKVHEVVEADQKRMKTDMSKGKKNCLFPPVQTEPCCQIDSENGSETRKTSLVNENTANDRVASAPQPRNGDRPIPSVSEYVQMLENRRSYLSRGRRSYHSADSDVTTSLDVDNFDNCSNASLCPTETVKSFGPFAENIESGKLSTNCVATEKIQPSGNDPGYEASKDAPQGGQIDAGIALVQEAPINGLSQGQETKGSPPGASELDQAARLVDSSPAMSTTSSENGTQPRVGSHGLPTTRMYKVLNPYSDQHGWTPFDDYKFVYAARVAVAEFENDFREILATEGGFRWFWDTCDLPKWNAPSQDTNALTPWEIDDLVNSIHAYSLLPEPVPTLIFGDFKARIIRTSLERALGVKNLLLHLHPLDEVTEVSDESLSTEEESSFLSTGNFRDVLQDDADGVLKYTVLHPASTGSVPIMTEEEKMTKVTRLLQNFRLKKEKKLQKDNIKITKHAVEAMPLTSERSWSASEVEDPNGMLFPGANGVSKTGCGHAQAEFTKASTTSWCRDCGRSYELLRSGKRARPSKRNGNGDGSDRSDETVESQCCGISSGSSDEDEKYCQGIV